MIYLDNSATTRPLDRVIETMSACMRSAYFNASAAYRPAVDVDRAMRECRRLIAAQAGAQEGDVIFTGGGTEGDNLAILGLAKTLRKPGNFVISAVEHPAVEQTVRRVVQMGHEVRVMPVDSRGVVDLEAAQRCIDEHTALVSCMQVGNETGAVQPIAPLCALARRKNPQVKVHVDGVQGFMRVPVHMGRMGIDMYTLSGHKIHGPKGVGALIVRGVRLDPQMTGGGQERGIRSGTYDSPAILGLGEAIRAFCEDREAVQRMAAMKARLWERLSRVEGVRLNGPAPGEEDSAPHILSVSFEGVRGEVMRNALEGAGILVSTGSACSSHRQKVSPALRAMGLSTEQADGTVRVSLGMLNTMEEMEEAAAQMQAIYAALRPFRRR